MVDRRFPASHIPQYWRLRYVRLIYPSYFHSKMTAEGAVHAWMLQLVLQAAPPTWPMLAVIAVPDLGDIMVGHSARNRQVTTYFVYQQLSGQGCVRIHAGKCRHCREGRGNLRTGRSRTVGKWYGPYDYGEAFRVAQGLAVSDTRPCLRCMTSPHRPATDDG